MGCTKLRNVEWKWNPFVLSRAAIFVNVSLLAERFFKDLSGWLKEVELHLEKIREFLVFSLPITFLTV